MSMNRTRVAGAALAVTTVGAGLLGPLAAPAQAAQIELHARMRPTSAFPHTHGGARFESHPGWREFEIGRGGIRGLSGHQVTVTVHGAFVGRMTVHGDGHAHLMRHSGLPSMRAGNVVRVKTGSGRLVSVGTFHRRHHHMM